MAKYLSFAKVFLKKAAIKPYKRSDISKHSINLEPDKQSH